MCSSAQAPACARGGTTTRTGTRCGASPSTPVLGGLPHHSHMHPHLGTSMRGRLGNFNHVSQCLRLSWTEKTFYVETTSRRSLPYLRRRPLLLGAVAIGLKLSRWVESDLLTYPPTSTLIDLAVEFSTSRWRSPPSEVSPPLVLRVPRFHARGRLPPVACVCGGIDRCPHCGSIASRSRDATRPTVPQRRQ